MFHVSPPVKSLYSISFIIRNDKKKLLWRYATKVLLSKLIQITGQNSRDDGYWKCKAFSYSLLQ